MLISPRLRLCSHFTGQLLRRHENHTEYRLLITHENSDLGAISVEVMLHIVCYTTVFKCGHATLLPACVTTLKTAV